jgi:dienelactone hydrolase
MGRIPLTVALVVALAACSGGGSPATSSITSRGTSATSGPASPPSPAPFTRPGPYPVGVYTAEVDGRRVVVWYPAARSAAAQPKESFDLVSELPPEQQTLVPPDLRVPYEVDAHPGAEPATGRRYPVVVFVHGMAGFPEQSVDLTTHLAGWGFVVLAPEHVERSTSGDPLDPVRATVDLARTEDRRRASPLHGIVDADHVAVTGHSAGAAVAYRFAAADRRVDAYIGYAVPAVSGPAPKVPGMVMAATKDGIVAPAQSEAAFGTLTRPRYRVEVVGAGHLVFTDLCGMGAPFLGAGDLPPPVAPLQALLAQGCTDAFPPVRDDQSAIDDLTVDFLRTTLGVQAEPAGLDDPDVASAFAAEVRVTADS